MLALRDNEQKLLNPALNTNNYTLWSSVFGFPTRLLK